MADIERRQSNIAVLKTLRDDHASISKRGIIQIEYLKHRKTTKRVCYVACTCLIQFIVAKSETYDTDFFNHIHERIDRLRNFFWFYLLVSVKGAA